MWTVYLMKRQVGAGVAPPLIHTDLCSYNEYISTIHSAPYHQDVIRAPTIK